MHERTTKLNESLIAREASDYEMRKAFHRLAEELEVENARLRGGIARLGGEAERLRTNASWRDNPDRSGGWSDPNERHEMGG